MNTWGMLGGMTEAPMTSAASVPQWTTGDRLRKARETAGLNQADLAREIGIGRTSVTHYETGQKEVPRLVILAWAFRCQVPPQWITSGEITPNNPDPGTSAQIRRGSSPREQLPQNYGLITLIRPIGTRRHLRRLVAA